MATRVAAFGAGLVLALGGALTMGSAAAADHPHGIKRVDLQNAPADLVERVERASIPT